MLISDKSATHYSVALANLKRAGRRRQGWWDGGWWLRKKVCVYHASFSFLQPSPQNKYWVGLFDTVVQIFILSLKRYKDGGNKRNDNGLQLGALFNL